ncbi:MAG: STAS domain-containing protein [Oscillospiraceae bacterium]|nr:STAS domain-containing protein [Oscillospiraceae bacterium]
MNIGKRIEQEKAVLIPEGWLDTKTAPKFGEEISSLPQEITELTIDMEKLQYISSARLRQIVAAHKKMNGALTITNVSPEILGIFKMTGFDKKLDIR